MSRSNTPDEPWGENPFPEGTPAHQSWTETNLWTKEHLALFQAEMLESRPSEEASPKEFLDHGLKVLAGQFDIWARAFSRSVVPTDQAAGLYEQLLNEFEQAMAANATRFTVSFLPEGLYTTEVRRLLLQRKQYWLGRMLRRVRKRKEANCAKAAANALDATERVRQVNEATEASENAPDALIANMGAVVEPVLSKPQRELAAPNHAASQPRSVVGTAEPKVPRRTPDLEKSRERLAFLESVATELATIKQDLTGHCTAKSLKRRHPRFVLWKYISKQELQEIVDGEQFWPRTFAESLTLRKFGITSRATLKKDRHKIRRVERDS